MGDPTDGALAGRGSARVAGLDEAIGSTRGRLPDLAAAASPAFIAAIFLLSLIPLLVTPVVPAIDFYNHVGRYFVLTHLDTLGYLRNSYAAAWAILPNLGLDIVALPFFRLLPPLIAAKAIVGLIFAAQFSGMLALNKALNGRINRASVLLAGILLYSYILGWGFANFLLASGIIFWGLAIWVWLRRRLIVAAVVCPLVAVVIFFCHGFAFALYGLSLALIEFGYWLQRRPRRLVDLIGPAIAVAVQAVLPAILFRMASTSEAGHSITQQISSAGGSSSMATMVKAHALHQTLSILRVANGPWLLLDIVTFFAIVVLLAWAWRARLLRPNVVAVPALLVLAVLCVLTPPSLFAVGKISDRVPLFAAMLLTATLVHYRRDGADGDAGARSPIIAGLALIFAVRLVAVTFGYARYSADFADFAEVAAQAPAGVIVAPATPLLASERDHDDMRCEMYAPLMLPLHANPVPLFAFASQQPIRQVGEMAQRSSIRTYGSEHVDPLAVTVPDWPYYLACDYSAPPPSGFDVVARRGRFMLLRARTPVEVPNGR